MPWHGRWSVGGESTRVPLRQHKLSRACATLQPLQGTLINLLRGGVKNRKIYSLKSESPKCSEYL